MTTPKPADLEIHSGHRWLIAPVFWAVFGAVCVLFQAWVYTKWAVDGNVRAFPSGGYEISTSRMVLIRLGEVVAVAGCVLPIVVTWRQSRAAGHVTLFAAVTAGFFLSWWTDPYSGAVHHAVGQSRFDLNVLSWGPYLPGWHGPMPQIMSFMEFTAYPLVMMWVAVSMFTLATLRRRRPHWSRARVALSTALVVLLVDVPLEETYMFLGGYAYPRALPHLTLFEGEWYQLPLTSPVGMVLIATMPVVLLVLYAKPGREVWILDGSLNLPRRVQPWIRLLAGVGFINACMLVFQGWMLLGSLASYPIDLPNWIDRPTP